MSLLVHQINDVSERLAQVLKIPRDTLMLVLTGFTKCSFPRFVGPFEYMPNKDRVIQLDNDEDMHDNRKCLERVKKLTLLASNSSHSLNVSNQLNIPYNYQNRMVKGKIPCDNCGG